MKLKDIEKSKVYEIVNFGKMNQEQLLDFYEQGVLEGEKIKLKDDIKLNSKVNLYELDGNIFSINKLYLEMIEVEETDE